MNELKSIPVNLFTCENVKCSKCSAMVFDMVNIIKIIPGLLIGQSENMFHTQNMARCVKCGNIENLEQWTTPVKIDGGKSLLEIEK